MVLRLTIKGRPITKKNSSRYVGHGRLLPSVQYVKYEKAEGYDGVRRSAQFCGNNADKDEEAVMLVTIENE